MPIILSLTAAVFAFAEEEYVEPHPGDEQFFRIILSKEHRNEFESLPPEHRIEWRARYWASLDPTPTTDVNQREMTHQARIVEAIRRFRNKHDQFVFDDRARAYIRFGEPNLIRTLPGEVVVHEGVKAPHEFWLYDDMILWFEDLRLNGYYFEGLRDAVSGIGALDQGLREDTGWKEDRRLIFQESFDRYLYVMDVEVEPHLARRYTEDGMHRFRELPEINDYDYEGGEEFNFLFDVSYLAGAGGGTDVLLGFLIPLEKVEFASEGGIESAKLQRRISLHDTDYTLVDRKVENMLHAVEPGEERPKWIVTCDSLAVDPGPYILALRVLDPRSKNHGIMKTPVEAPDFGGEKIRVSDIVFSASITRGERGDGAFIRGDYRIVPRPIRIFAPGEDVRVYFEIYNITSGAGGQGLYEVKYTLFGTKTKRFVSFFGGSSEGKLEQGIGQTFRARSRGGAASRHISLDTSSLPEDRYTLTIEATDLANDEKSSVRAQFVVKR